MTKAMVAILSAAVLVVVAGIGAGASRAGEVDPGMEEAPGSSYDSPSILMEETLVQGPAETGRLPGGSGAEIWVEEGLGSSFDYLPEPGP